MLTMAATLDNNKEKKRILSKNMKTTKIKRVSNANKDRNSRTNLPF
jgi:hypothetical protein